MSNENALIPRRSLWPLAIMATIYFLVEFVPNLKDGYGYFIDELYYLACAKRLALGYVDHPPVSIWILAAWTKIFGISLPSIKFMPALFGGLTVLMTGLLARRVGAGLFGQLLAALTYMSSAVPLVVFGLYSMNAMQLFLWTVLLYILVEIADKGSSRLWIWFGIVAGIGLMNKHTLILLAAGLTLGLLLTPARKFLIEKNLWIGAGVAALILLPNLIWQALNGWPSAEFYRNAALEKNLSAGPLEVILAQLMFMNAVVWVPGLFFLMFSKRFRQWRFIGWMFLTLLMLLILSGQSRADRLAGIYPILFAFGARWWESVSIRRKWSWLRYLLVVLLVSAMLILLPIGVPVLSPAQTTAYVSWFGIDTQAERGEGKKSELPQWMADRFGWPELAADVAVVWESVPGDERSKTIILAPSYGHAGAIEMYGPQYGLPPVAGLQNNYFLWGLPDQEITTVISLGIGPRSLDRVFESVEEVGHYTCEFCMPWRNNMDIYLARGPKADLREAWEDLGYFE